MCMSTVTEGNSGSEVVADRWIPASRWGGTEPDLPVSKGRPMGTACEGKPPSFLVLRQ